MFWPTPGSSEMMGILRLSRVSFGPIPETMRSCGERNCDGQWKFMESLRFLTAPDDSITSFVALS